MNIGTFTTCYAIKLELNYFIHIYIVKKIGGESFDKEKSGHQKHATEYWSHKPAIFVEKKFCIVDWTCQEVKLEYDLFKLG